MSLKDDKQQNIQMQLDFSSTLTGEAREAGREETESAGAMNGTENPASTNRLMEEVCAAACLRRERRDHTLQPTALVHEAYLRLVDQAQVECQNRAQFFAIAANLMRQILVDHARRHRAAKRGGGNNKVALDEAVGMAVRQEVDLLALDEALGDLARIDPRQGRVVELRFFGGLTEDEIAGLLEVSPITVKRDWRIARAVLHHQLGGGVLG
jgi:RNA polymerase sigma factor (TIGR02999 family)